MKFPYCQHRHSRPNPNAPALEIQGLGVSYSSEGKFALRILISACRRVQPWPWSGQRCGKSTLFKAICGLLPVRCGTIRIFGHSLGACHHRVVFLPQRSEIDWQFPVSVLDFVTMGRYVYLGWFMPPDRKRYGYCPPRSKRNECIGFGASADQ